MRMPSRLPFLICFLAFLSFPSFAQRAATRPTNSTPSSSAQSPGLSANNNSVDSVANELALLRKSLQTLNIRLQAISEELLAPDSKQNDSSGNGVKRISTNLDLLTRAEERAGVLRKQLIESIEKETALKSRRTQIDEDMRPENIERTMSGIGTTRTAELRDARRRVLENERKGVESLLSLSTQDRLRLEEDVRQADQMVARIRQRLFPLIDKEIEKINPNP
jgi:hypothetical protein